MATSLTMSEFDAFLKEFYPKDEIEFLAAGRMQRTHPAHHGRGNILFEGRDLARRPELRGAVSDLLLDDHER